MLGTLVFIAISIGVVCVVVLLASRKKELLQRVLFWVGAGARCEDHEKGLQLNCGLWDYCCFSLQNC